MPFPSPIFTDDFETYALGDLINGGVWDGNSAFQVENTVVQSGTKAVSVLTSGSTININRESVAQNIGRQGFYIKLAQNDVQFEVKFLRGSDDATAMDIIFSESAAAGKVYWENGNDGEVEFATYAVNTWYEVIFEWNSSDHLYRITFNGVTTPWRTGVAANPDSATKIRLQGRGTGTCYWDNFWVAGREVSVSDTISLAEVMTTLKGALINVSDTISLSEFLTVLNRWTDRAKNVSTFLNGAKSAVSSAINRVKNSSNWTNTDKS